MAIQRIQPAGLFDMPGFSHVVVGSGRMAFVAGQGAIDEQFNVVGGGDYFAQTHAALGNVITALRAIDAAPEQVVSSTFYVVSLTPAAVEQVGRALGVACGGEPFPPHAYNLIGVTALGHPDMLVEIAAIALLD